MLVSEFAVCSQWLLVASFVHRYIYPCAAIAECLAGKMFAILFATFVIMSRDS